MRPGPTRVETYCLKVLARGAALAAVENAHGHVLLHAAERRTDHVCRDAGALRLRRYVLDEAAEVAAAAGGKRGSGASEGREDRSEAKGETRERHGEMVPCGERVVESWPSSNTSLTILREQRRMLKNVRRA